MPPAGRSPGAIHAVSADDPDVGVSRRQVEVGLAAAGPQHPHAVGEHVLDRLAQRLDALDLDAGQLAHGAPG
jgi:hypothetical protein